MDKPIGSKMKKLIIISIVIVSTLLYSIYIRKGRDIDFEDPNNKIPNQETKKSISKPLSSEIEIDTQGETHNNFRIDLEIQKLNTKLNYHGVCGFDASSFFNKFEYLKEDLSLKQIKIKENMIDRCNQWFNYLDSLSIDERNVYKKNIEDFKKTNQYFDGIDRYDEAKIKTAKQILDVDGDGTILTYDAINYLLFNDRNLRSELAKKIRTKDHGYIKNAGKDIAMQYLCETDPPACLPDAIDMMYLCLSDESYCGLSYSQYLSSTRTPGQYNDILSMTAILRKLIADGYFSEELD